jgi:hypothetical protein
LFVYSKSLLAKITGTSALQTKNQFSKEALAKTVKEFRKLDFQRREWVDEYGISKIIKTAPHYAGKFIIGDIITF